MNYFKLMDEIFDLCISKTDESDLWYLTPHWRKLICEYKASNEIEFIECINRENVSLTELEDILRLEVERRNKIEDKSNLVNSWLYVLLSTQIEPTMLQEESEYIQSVVEFMKVKDSIERKENKDDKVVHLDKFGKLNFSKKK